jgi:acid phosphatase
VTTPDTSAATATTVTKVLVVVLENHSRQSALAGMPRLAQRGSRYAIATRSYAVTHPSLPNYLAIVGGSTFGVRDDRPPARHRITGTSVFGQVLASGGTARTYAEGMSHSCQTSDGGRYAVRHNPWTYFVGERAACQQHDLPAGTPTRGQLHDDVTAGRLPTFGLLVPDACNDAHDCSLRTADRWLDSWLDVVTAGEDFRDGRLLVMVTFDEDDHDAGNHILTVLLHPALQHATIDTGFDQYAVSGLVSRLVGAAPLRRAASATDLLHVVRAAMTSP